MPLATVVVRIAAVAVVLALLGTAAVCAMKGKWVFFVLGWFSGVWWIVGAMRLAKPNSYWARTRYGDVELERAQQRFSGRPLARLLRRRTGPSS